MGLLDIQPKPYRKPTSTPIIDTPIITDAPICPVGLSRDGKTLIGASTSSPWQLHFSNDDGVSWSVGQLPAAGDVSQILGAIELPTGELLLTFASSRACSRTGNWKNRSMTTAGGMTSTGVMTARASGIAPRPQWGFGNWGELTLMAEYGSKTADPATTCRYIFLSKDDGSTFVPIFDLLSQDVRGIPGLEMVPAAGAYHCHAVAYDKWADRIWATGGDSNDWIIYSDDAARIEIINDIATTSGSTTITAANTAKTSFAARHVGKSIRGNGIPAGTTIASVTNAYTAVLSQAATATASNVIAWMGNITWNVHHYGRAGRYQVVGILPTEQGVFFGADGYPTGFHFSQRGFNGKPSVLENILNTDPTYKTNVGQHLQMGMFRAEWTPDAPILVTGDSNDTDTGAYLALIHPSHKRTWELWRDSYKVAYSGCQQIWYTANGNIIGQMKSARTGSGYQMFKVAMPSLPTSSAL